MRHTRSLLFSLSAAAAVFVLTGADVAAARPADIVLRELAPVPPQALPPLPGENIFPVQLVVDDGTAESSLGVGNPTARQFLWFNRFSPTGPPFNLREIWVLFPDDPAFGPGDEIELVVYQDEDGDPASGATLRLALSEVVQAADGVTFSVYLLPDPILLTTDADTYLGVVNRFVESGVSPSSMAAAFDSGATQGQSFLAVWSGDPPSPPELPPDLSLFDLESFQPGRWTIRGFGAPVSPVAIPGLDASGLTLLAALLAACGTLVLGRRL